MTTDAATMVAAAATAAATAIAAAEVAGWMAVHGRVSVYVIYTICGRFH
jgi:hypothetical protein